MNCFLVTGSAGFIGSSLCEELLKNSDCKVVGIDNFDDFYPREFKEKNISSLRNDKNYFFHEIDIKNSTDLQKIFAKYQPSQVIHLAANAGVRPSLQNPKKCHENNIFGTLNILEVCREFKVPKLIFASSSSVYGQMTEFPFHEEMKIDKPISPYASTKLSCEHLCYTYSHLYNLQVVILRFFTAYGPRQRPDLAIHKFSDLIFSEKEIEIYGDGKTKRDYTYISDILQGIIGAMNYNKTKYEIFNLGESRAVELGYLTTLLEKNLGKKATIKYRDKQAGDVDVTYANIDKARNLLGYSPKTHIETGIKLFTDWFLLNKIS